MRLRQHVRHHPRQGPRKLQIFLGGFEPQSIDAAGGANLDITLKLAAVTETLTVTATADRDGQFGAVEPFLSSCGAAVGVGDAFLSKAIEGCTLALLSLVVSRASQRVTTQ